MFLDWKQSIYVEAGRQTYRWTTWRILDDKAKMVHSSSFSIFFIDHMTMSHIVPLLVPKKRILKCPFLLISFQDCCHVDQNLSTGGRVCKVPGPCLPGLLKNWFLDSYIWSICSQYWWTLSLYQHSTVSWLASTPVSQSSSHFGRRLNIVHPISKCYYTFLHYDLEPLQKQVNCL